MRSVGGWVGIASRAPPLLVFCHYEGHLLTSGGGGLGHLAAWDSVADFQLARCQCPSCCTSPSPLRLWQNGTLKTALLDYIKRCRPGDSEKHNMIALCFSMCREIGENHEAAANVQLKLIESQPWGKDSPAQVDPSGGDWLDRGCTRGPIGLGWSRLLVAHLASPEEAKNAEGPAPLPLSFRL